MLNKMQARELFASAQNAMKNDDAQALATALQSAVSSGQIDQPTAKAIFEGAKANDGLAIKRAIQSQRNDLASIVEESTKDPLDAMREQAEKGSYLDKVALNLFPATARSIAGDGSALEGLTAFGKDVVTSGLRGLWGLMSGDQLGMAQVAPTAQIDPTKPLLSADNLLNATKMVGQSLATDPTLPFGGVAMKGAQGLVKGGSMLARLGQGAVTGGGLGFGSELINQTANPTEDYDAKNLFKATTMGIGLGALGSGGAYGISKALPKAQVAPAVSGEGQALVQGAMEPQGLQKPITDVLAEGTIQGAKKAGLTSKELMNVPAQYRGVMQSLEGDEPQVFDKFMKQAVDYHGRKSGAMRPLEADANEQMSTLLGKLDDYRKSAGEEMGEIESRGLQGGVDIEPIRAKLEQTLGEHGLVVSKDKKGKYILRQGTEGADFSPEKHPELQSIVDVFYNELGNLDNVTGTALRRAQKRAINNSQKDVGVGQANQADRILSILDDDIDNVIANQLDAEAPNLSQEYARARQKYAQSKQAESFLGKRIGTPLKWTDDAGNTHEGMQTGASFYQALTNTGAQQRGATFLADLAERELGMPNLQRRAVMARYAEEAAGIRGPRTAEAPKGLIKKAVSAVKTEKSKVKSMLPEQAKIAQKIMANKEEPSRFRKIMDTKASLKEAPIASRGIAQAVGSPEDKKKLKFTQSVAKGIQGKR